MARAKQTMKKKIKITNRGMFQTSRGMCRTPILRPYLESIDYIFRMIAKGAKIVEVLDDGTEIELTEQNFNLDNSKKVVKKEEPKKPEAPKAEPAKVVTPAPAAKPEAPKAEEPKKPEAPKAEPVKVEEPKKPEAPKAPEVKPAAEPAKEVKPEANKPQQQPAPQKQEDKKEEKPVAVPDDAIEK